ncbi:MAG: hypothetical protein A2847_00285 [Candidatus Sungbacteria bacterium RIFCSPHIGHO2_01_FULL_50_25]|uniref:Uncharacterized protein n=1 Tax=Candidatus Sungbacteria bacterium RIFCSPHIGHO2_01_FULL_50_25 TaxID=1802265 RepID=A0A1G2KD68_9BACT|nr:MAG: hypothetical protein A2847_00285 [Candidatus Sungbacteria bacterium RIFCSPHIGHO2_01_FULL_50_25]
MRESRLKKTIRYIRGTTLLEIVIYAALFGIIAVIISNFLIQVVNTYTITRAEREVLSNGRLLLETLTKTIAEAQEIYTPTSAFNKDLGQLSLMTRTGVPTEHQTAYVDFWIDNGRMWMRKEGAAAVPLSAASVRVSKFRLERISQGLSRDAVKLTLQVDFTQSKYQSSITLNSTTALRGNY